MRMSFLACLRGGIRGIRTVTAGSGRDPLRTTGTRPPDPVQYPRPPLAPRPPLFPVRTARRPYGRRHAVRGEGRGMAAHHPGRPPVPGLDGRCVGAVHARAALHRPPGLPEPEPPRSERGGVRDRVRSGPPGLHHQSGLRTPGLVPDPPRAPRRALGTQTRAGGTGPDSGPGRQEDPDPGLQASPDLLLVSATRLGALSQTQAQLIAQNRLENIPLSQIAEQSGVSYKALAKRRERAETRLRRAVSAGEVVIADALLRSEGLHDHERAALRLVAAAPTPGKPLSHRPLPQAS